VKLRKDQGNGFGTGEGKTVREGDGRWRAEKGAGEIKGKGTCKIDSRTQK